MCLPDPEEMIVLTRWPHDMCRLRGPYGEIYGPKPAMATRNPYTKLRAWARRLARRSA